jgi:outer membrane translocation and assembly module TamA
MRSRFAQIVALATTGLLPGKVSVQAQSTDVPAISVTCPALSDLDDRQPDGQPPSRPEISIAAVKISGAIRIPISDQDAIVNSIKLQIHGDSVDLVTEQALERVRAAWQDRGYFKVQVSGKAKLSTGSHGRRIVIEVRVEEGMQYRLSEITFKNNRVISDTAGMRGLFPIKDGDIFSREKIAAGLENLRKSYGELGYLNFTAVPDTVYDDAREMISLEIDVDEGKQFYVSSIDIVGLDERSRRGILMDFPVGQVYNEKRFRSFLKKYQPAFKLRPDDPRLTARRLDEQTGAVSITLYACPCRVCY